MLLLLPVNSLKAGEMLSMAGSSRGIWNTTERSRQNQQLKIKVRKHKQQAHRENSPQQSTWPQEAEAQALLEAWVFKVLAGLSSTNVRLVSLKKVIQLLYKHVHWT